MPRRRKQIAPVRQAAPPSRAALVWAIAVAASAVLVYLNAFGNGFVLDDTRLVRDNVRIRSLASVPQLFASSYWGIEGAQGLYRPLALASFAVNYALHGLEPGGYIAVNVALHAGVSLALFALVRALGGSPLVAGAAGVLFAVHPVHTEAVAGISGRPELLAALFSLLALFLHRRAASSLRPGLGTRAAALACFALALLSKESAITLLLVAPAMDAILPVQRQDGETITPRSRILRDYLPLIAVALVYLAVRRAVLGGIVIAGHAIAPLDNPLVAVAPTPLGDLMGATRGQALMTAFAVMGEYARLLLWPARLSPDYSYNQIPLVTSPGDVRFLIGVALAAACLAAIVWLWRRSPLAAFGLAFVALTYSIVSNLAITIGTICAERLIYLPSAGAFILAAVVLERVAASAPSRRRIALAAFAAIVVAASARTIARNRDWRDETALWSSAVAIAPSSARVQSEYGRLLLARAEAAAAAGRTDEGERLYADARAHYESAVAIYPAYSLPLDGLAMIASEHERFDEANALYERAMQAWPGNYASLANWASLRWDHARGLRAQAMQLRQDGKVAESDALLRQAEGWFRQSADQIDRAVAMMPSYAHAHLVRAMILESYAGDKNGAIAEFEEVLRLEPNHPQRALIEDELQRLRTR